MHAREMSDPPSTVRHASRRLATTMLIGIGVLTGGPFSLAAPRDDMDWPCQQRLVPILGAGAFGIGPPPDSAGDWRAEPRVADLVRHIAPRRVAAEAGVAAIAAFAASLGPDEDKPRLLALAFAGLLDETNRERADVIARLKELGRRQHELADIASRAAAELRALPTGATGEDVARRTDLEQRFAFVTQAFENTQRTMRYACETPVKLEARLGRYAQAIKSHL